MTAASRPDSAVVVTSIGEVRPQVRADVSGVIRSVRAMSIGGTPACSYTLADGTGRLDLLFLGRVEVAGLEKGRRCRAEGMVAVRDDRHVIWNPKYWIQPEDQADQDLGVGDAGQELSRVAASVRSPAGLRARPSAGRPACLPDCHPARPRADGPALRVLVVDDDKAIRRVLEVSLKAHGYHVDLAATGEEAVALAGLGPDLILLDVGLPDIDGLMVISQIQAECDALIIVISAREMTATRTAALAAGAVDYVPKPFSIDQLLATIRLMAPPWDGPLLAATGMSARG
jgi:CheY-like chemotaxis protein